jgi:predicted phosphodiesterase
VPLGVVGRPGASGQGDSLTAVRVAVVSDIHGNLPALEAVLAEVEAEGVDAVVCTGDVLGGPFSADVFDRLAGLGAQVVRGNADRFVVEGTDEHGRDWESERARLGGERLDAVAAWPLTVELEVDGLGRALFFHAVPTADEPIFTKITPDEDVAELIGENDAALCVCGHTHMQFDRQLASGLRVVNAGSVGLPYEGRRGAFWAQLGPDVQFRHTEYDAEAAVVSLRQAAESWDEDYWHHLLDPPDPDETARFFESQRGA